MAAMRGRMGAFGLRLHPDKTRLVEFGREAAESRRRRGLGKPETFDFLGFTHICGVTRKGRFSLHRKTRADRLRATLRQVKDTLRRRLHEPIEEQGAWLRQVVRGYFAYHAVPNNIQALGTFRRHVGRLWGRALRRRSQKDRTPWGAVTKLADHWLPKPTSSILGQIAALPPTTRGGSPVRECRTPGSVRGVRRNAHPYRNKGRVLKHATPLMQRLLVDLPAVLSDEPLVGLKKRLRGRSHDRRRRCTDIADPPEDDGRRALARLRAADAGDAEDWASARTKLGFAYAQRSDGDRSENWELAIAAFTDALSVARGEPGGVGSRQRTPRRCPLRALRRGPIGEPRASHRRL
jgi:hypothetical protein